MTTEELKYIEIPENNKRYEVAVTQEALNDTLVNYGSAIVKTANGDIASFTDGADDVPVKSLSVNIVPKQSGSGDPSPSNVRPISGYEGVNVTRCGKNLFEVTDITADNWNGSVAYSITHLQLTKETNGVSIVTYGGESTQQWVLRKFNLIPNEAYSFGYVSSVGNERIFIRLFDGDGNNISSASIPISGFTYNQWFSAYFKNGGQATFTIPSNCSYAWVGFGVTGQAKDTKVYFTDIQLELGSTATTYEPYQGTSYSIPLPSTVYGGTLNVTTGELNLTYGMVDLGSLNWAYNSSTTLFRANIT
ncbi:MAG: hypothetical protein IIZ94_11085, partial [Prevotella sp.]|nr:hypothetical protein [Prevotella sp.]